MSEQLKRWSPTSRMEEIGKRPVGYMIGDKRGQWCWAKAAEERIATLTAERDAFSATLRQGAESDVDLRTKYTALEKERDGLYAENRAMLRALIEEDAAVIYRVTCRMIASRTAPAKETE